MTHLKQNFFLKNYWNGLSADFFSVMYFLLTVMNARKIARL